MIKTLKENAVFQNKFIVVYNNEVEFENKATGTFLRIFASGERNPKAGVAVLCVNQNEEILLIKSYRYSIDKTVWEIPRGRYEGNEGFFSGAKRELQEETGIEKILGETHLGSFYVDTGLLASEADLVLINVENTNNLELQSEESITDFKWMKIEEIKKEILIGNLKDPFLETALFRYLINKG